MNSGKTPQAIDLEDVFCPDTRAVFRALLLTRHKSEEFSAMYLEFSEVILSRAPLLNDE